MFDPYEELGVERDASDKEIAAAAKRHAKEHHPDKGGGDRERFEAGRRALVVLKDPAKRSKFDRTGKVDEDAVDNDLAAAMQLIVAEVAQVLNSFIENHFGKETEAQWDPRKVPIFDRMKIAFAGKIAEGKMSVKASERQVAFLRDFAGRLSIKKKKGMPEVDFVKRALEDQIRNFEETIEHARDGQRRHELAIELLSIYNYRVDVPQHVFNPLGITQWPISTS